MPTLPQVTACGADVDISVCHAAWDARIAHAFNLHVKAGVADLITVSLPLIVGVIGQIVTPDIALSYHSALLFCATLGDLHIAMPTRLKNREECDCFYY